MQLMALLKELICGSYSGSLQANDLSESRDLLDQSRVIDVKHCSAVGGNL